MVNLYRIIDFPTFINLIENRVEWFARPDSWEDKHEGYWFQTLNSQEKIRKAVEILFTDVSPNNAGAAIQNFFKLWSIKYTCLGQCWSRTKESDTLWKAITPDKASVQIKTTETRLNNRLECIKDAYSIFIKDVVYDLKGDNLLKKQAGSIKESKNTVEPYFHKRPCFSHEKEKRVILMDKQLSSFYIGAAFNKAGNEFNRAIDKKDKLSKEELIECISNEIVKTMSYIKLNNDNKGKAILIDSKMKLSDYITGVRVNPLAEDWIVSLVEVLCKKNGLKFCGKSDIYAVVK